MPTARLHDGSALEIEVTGDGPAVLLPVNPTPVEGARAEALRKYGADPALGRSLIQGLCDTFRVVAFDYEGHVLGTPKPETLTPENVARDFLAVADAAGVRRFAWYGYSWLAMVGLQLAARTDRLWGLAMGGFPPLEGPYREMLRVTSASYERAGEPARPDDEWSGSELSKDGTRQFVTLYQALQSFDDRQVLARLPCPGLCLVGGADEVRYGPGWGDVEVRLAEPVVRHRAELESLGWEVHVLPGLDHMGAMAASQVLPLLRPWLARVSTLEARK